MSDLDKNVPNVSATVVIGTLLSGFPWNQSDSQDRGRQIWKSIIFKCTHRDLWLLWPRLSGLLDAPVMY